MIAQAHSRCSHGPARLSGRLFQYQPVPWHLPGLLSSLIASPITQREHLNGRHRANVYPVGLPTHTISVNTSYHSPVYANRLPPPCLRHSPHAFSPLLA